MLNDPHVQSADAPINTVLAPKGSETFSWRQFAIVAIVHLSAIPAFLSINKIYVIAWFIAHLVFVTIGVSIGLHRLFSHRSFVPNRPMFYFIATIATLCFQGGPIFWAAAHRNHHRFTEAYGDPHSASRGFWWSHIGWLFFSFPNGFSYLKSLRLTSDWRKDKYAMWLETQSTNLNLGFLAILFVACVVCHHPGLFFWIGPLRIVTVWHSTWILNSFAHNAYRSESKRGPTKISLLNVIIAGEGNHEFHHRHASSVCHTDCKHNFDFGYKVLKSFQFLRLVKFRAPQWRQDLAPAAAADASYRTKKSEADKTA